MAILAGCGVDGGLHGTWRLDFTGSASHAIWGSAPDDLFVEGGPGFVAHYDGIDFQVQPLPADGTVRAIWGAARDDVYAISGDEILNFDGREWSLVYQASDSLTDIWGSAPDEIHAVGLNGLAVYFDGARWSEMETGVSWNLRQVEGTGPDRVYAVGIAPGDPEAMLRFDGSAWQRQSVRSAAYLQSLAANPSTGRAYMGDATGWLFIGSGASFGDFTWVDRSPESLAVARELELIGSDNAGRIFIWADGHTDYYSFPAAVRAVWASAWGDTYGVGDDGQIVVDDGTEFRTLRPDHAVRALGRVFGAPDGTLFALGTEDFLFEDGDWVAVEGGSANTAGSAVSKDFAVAVGLGDIEHWNGERWEGVASPTSEPLRDVWAFDEAEAWAVGYFGAVLHFDGVRWSQTTALGGSLNGVHGTAPDDVFACGQLGHVYHYDGALWREIPTPTSAALNALWAVSPSDVYAVGAGGTALHYDGSAWERMDFPTSETLVDLWARDERSVFALSSSGTVYRFDGMFWEEATSPPGNLAIDLWGTADSLLAVGSDALVFRIDL